MQSDMDNTEKQCYTQPPSCTLWRLFVLPKPTPERLREMLEYDPHTGDLTWRVSRPHIRRGDDAGALTSRGHILLSVDGCRLAATQAIWAMVHGEYPTRRIQHKDKDPTNLRFENLTLYRELTPERSREATKVAELRKVNDAALRLIMDDPILSRDYTAGDALTQRRILAKHRDELRNRYPKQYPSSHLMRLGRKRKARP